MFKLKVHQNLNLWDVAKTAMCLCSVNFCLFLLLLSLYHEVSFEMKFDLRQLETILCLV